MANFPASLDNGTSLPNPSGANTQNNPDHAGLHTAENAAIIATQTKVGTGASTPAANTLLVGTGAGVSAWSQLTSAQLAAILSDETGTGAAVFANTPVLITPKVDTINENTVGNGVTVAGINLKSGVVQTPSSVGTTALANGAVTPNKLATGATAALIATSESTASLTYVDLATVGPSVTVNIGVNGLALVILYAAFSNTVSTANSHMAFAVSGASTVASADNYSNEVRQLDAASGGLERQGADFLVTGLTAGSTTFTAKYKTNAGSAFFADRRIAVIPL